MTKEIERSLEEIHRQLKGDERDLSSNSVKSLNYYMRSISHRLAEFLIAQERDQQKHRYNLSWAMGVIGIVGVLLAIGRWGNSDIEWIEHHRLTLQLWGVTLCTIFVGVSLERSALIKSLWSFYITKLIVSIILSGAIFYARGRAAGLVNSVFHVDASAFTVTLVLTTGLVLFKLLIPFVLALATITALAHFLIVLTWIKAKWAGDDVELPPLFSLLSICVSSVILLFGSGWSNEELNDSRISEKIYLMAHALDFNYSHECANVKTSKPVVFLGNTQESVLVAPFALEDFDFATFFEASVVVPTDFARQKCEYKSLEVDD